MGNISLNPQFADPMNGNFHLQADSPCIDAGCLIEYLTTDYEGDTRGYDGTSEPRHDGSDYDIGAEEYSGVVPTPVTTPVPTSIYAPVISKLPDIFISDTEDNTETMDVNFFCFQNALDLDAYVSDLDTTISELVWSFKESGPDYLKINGITQLVSADDAIIAAQFR